MNGFVNDGMRETPRLLLLYRKDLHILMRVVSSVISSTDKDVALWMRSPIVESCGSLEWINVGSLTVVRESCAID